MTFYDDGEFAALKMVRIAHAEEDGQPRSADMHAVVQDMFDRHGSDGVSALCVAMARQYSAALAEVARQRGESVIAVLDQFEQHKLDQVTGDYDA